MNRNRSPISNTIRNGVRRGPLLVVIPTSTEAASDVSRALEAVREAAERPATGDVVVVVSVEGREDSPEAYSALCEAMAVLRTPAHVRVYVTGTSEQGGGVAIERALAFMDTLVEMGVWTAPYARVTVTNRGSNVRELRLSAPPRTVVAQPVLVRAA